MIPKWCLYRSMQTAAMVLGITSHRPLVIDAEIATRKVAILNSHPPGRHCQSTAMVAVSMS